MKLHVRGQAAPLQGTFDPPSSKNYTTRYIIASCLAKGESIVRRPAIQDDAVALVDCCRAMGAVIEALDARGRSTEFGVLNKDNIDRLAIMGFGAAPRVAAGAALNPGNAGAVLRILMAVSVLLPEAHWVTAHADSLGKRPNEDLLSALGQLGVEVAAQGPQGTLPIRLRGGIDRIKAHLSARRTREGLADHEPLTVEVSGSISSQFTSALLMLAPLLDQNLRITVTGKLLSRPLIETTRDVLRDAGVEVESDADRTVHVVRRGQRYKPGTWDTNGDWPGAAAMLAAAAAVPGSSIRLRHLLDDRQGERESAAFFRAMGCEVAFEDGAVALTSPAGAPLQGRGVNGDLCTDAVLAMMGAAAVAEGESRFAGIRNLQFKECDRVREPIAELRKVYAGALTDGLPPPEKAVRWEPSDDPDVIRLTGSPQGFRGGIDVDGRGDHRVIMMLSILALRCREGLTITGAEHVSKSFPGWFDFLRAAGVGVVEVG